MENKKGVSKYLSTLLTGSNIVTSLVLSILIFVGVYFAEAFSLCEIIASLQLVKNIAFLVPVSIGVIVLLITLFKGLFAKEFNFADKISLLGVFSSIMSLIYALMFIGSDTFKVKMIAFAIIIMVTLILLALRLNFCDGSVITDGIVHPKANADAKSYYGEFFKKYLVVAIAFALVAIVGLIILDQANFISILIDAKNIKVTGAVGIIAVLAFLILYIARLNDKDIDFMDVALFVMIITGVALLPLTFFVGEKIKLLVALTGLALIIISALLTQILIKNTHIETNAEKNEYAQHKSGFAVYFKALKAHVNLNVFLGIALIFAGIIVGLVATGMLTKIVRALNVPDMFHFYLAVLCVGLFVLLLMFCDVTLHRIESMDFVFICVFISSVLAFIIDQVVVGDKFILSGLAFLILAVLSAGFVLIRIKFVKEVVGEEVKAEALVNEEVAVAVAPIVEETKEEVKPIVEETKEEAVLETAVEEKKEETVTLPVEEEEEPLVEEVPNKRKRVNVKKSYEMYIRTGDDQLKENYSVLKNELLSYGLHARMTKARENFSKKGITISKVEPDKNLRLQAKLFIRGKFLKLYLNVDPNSVDAKYFRISDVSEKMPDQPTYIKIRSKLSLKRALELIAILAEKEGFTKKKKVDEVDYKSMYVDDGLTHMQKLGYDYMIKDRVTFEEVLCYKEDWAERVVKTKIVSDAERYIYDVVTLDTLAKEFNSGDFIDLEILRSKGLIKANCNHLTVKPSKTLSKKFFIEANVIDNKTVQMIAIAGGEATRLVFN